MSQSIEKVLFTDLAQIIEQGKSQLTKQAKELPSQRTTTRLTEMKTGRPKKGAAGNNWVYQNRYKF
jgi:hypothetical protein